MRFGLFHNLHDTTRRRDYADLLDELRELAAICDATDFDVLWMPEHHFSVWGRELLPNPLMTAVDLAARTRRIRIGLAAAIVTFWHPLRAAEDIALLDQLTGGRVEVGFGRGNYGLEASNLNPAADPNDQVRNKLVFDEAVSVIKAALTQERFAFKGQVFQFPAPGFRADRAHTVTDSEYVDPQTGELIKLSIFPRARQQPLPMWEMVNSLDSIEHAARQDLGIIMWRPPVAALRERLRVYRDTLRQATGKELQLGARAAVMRDTFVADTEEEAVRIAGGPMMDSLNFSNWRGPSVYLDPSETLPGEQEAALKKRLTYEFVRDRSVYFGPPEKIVQQILHLHRETGIDSVIFKTSWSGLQHAAARESVLRLGTEVIPAVRAALRTQQRAVAAE
ncbi:MAG TPA: LLM class flavin-dependent oxidoreductase [Acetobacteraceae bacterium]|nr:LLM class flavin-dependent oxidoreductase [Acetobacteraceae bacterium]